MSRLERSAFCLVGFALALAWRFGVCTLLSESDHTDFVTLSCQYDMALSRVLGCTHRAVVALEANATICDRHETSKKGQPRTLGRMRGQPKRLECAVEQHLHAISIIKLAHTIYGGSVKLECSQ